MERIARKYFTLLREVFMKNQFVKFIFVGMVNTLFGYSIYSLLIFLNLHYTIASLLSTVVGVLFNFKSIGMFVFNNKSNKLIVRFIMVYVITYFINIGLISIIKLYFNLYISAAILIIPIALLSFYLNRRFVFKMQV